MNKTLSIAAICISILALYCSHASNVPDSLITRANNAFAEFESVMVEMNKENPFSRYCTYSTSDNQWEFSKGFHSHSNGSPAGIMDYDVNGSRWFTTNTGNAINVPCYFEKPYWLTNNH